jgi:antitoxin YefM
MLVANVSDVRKNLKRYIDSVADNNDTLVINGNGKTVVMVSLEDYNSWDETQYLLSSPANAKELRDSIAQLTSGKVVPKTIEDLDIEASK